MASGDDEFEQLFDAVYPQLCRFLDHLLGGRGADEDIAQEAFLRLHRLGAGRPPAGEARYWLFGVARNLALNELGRRRTRERWRVRVAGLFGLRAPNPEECLATDERRRMIRAWLGALPEHQRAALLLREQAGMSYREIARVLDVSEAKVKVDIFRARSALRAKWRHMVLVECVAVHRENLPAR